MILIGQYDSPFVRRVGIALRLYGLDFEHSPLSVFRDAAAIAQVNPLTRVPVLVLDDGDVLIESAAILDHLDQQVPPAAAMLPRDGRERRIALKTCALATGLAEKAVSLVYERVLHERMSDAWVERCADQIGRTASALEAERSSRGTPYWFGERIGHADVAVACALRFTCEAHPNLFDLAAYPALKAQSEGCEALPAFRAIAQTFDPPR